MRFALSEDQRAIGEAVREMLLAECTPAAVRAAWESGPVDAGWSSLVEMGVLGMAVAEDRGGLGLGLVDLEPVMRAAGEVALPHDLVAAAAVAAPVLARIDHPRAAEALERLLAGDATVAVVHPLHPRATRGEGADLFLHLTDRAVTLATRAEVELAPRASADRSRRACDITLRGGTALATGAQAAELTALAGARGAWATASVLLGLGRRAVDMAVEHATVRHQFKKPIGSFQAVKHQMTNALLGLAFAEPHVMHAAWAVDHDAFGATASVAMAKHEAGTAAVAATRAALQVHGAIGYSFEHDLHLWMKRAWALDRLWGDPAHHRRLLADGWLADTPTIPDPRELPHA